MIQGAAQFTVIRPAAGNPAQYPGLPNMGDALLGLFQPLELAKVETRIENAVAVEVIRPLPAQGVVQPMSARQLALKPEGERTWKWKLIHCAPGLVLAPNDVIQYKAERYRVNGQWDFSEYGYLLYEVVNDFQPKVRIP